jgi:hypothetical protein
MVAKNPDCTGQRYGRLLVLGKGSKRPYKNTFRQLWKLQCDCGKIIERPRGDFENKGQVSCGCKRKLGLVDNKRRPKDITGQKFGNLTAIKLTGNKVGGKPTWLLHCNCGGTREMSLTRLSRGNKLNCGDAIHFPGSWYPPTPKPYPQEAGEILKKYLHLTELQYDCVDSEVEDEKRDRLIRAAWIITYRRQQGENISDLHESKIIRKHLRYCSIDVFWRRKIKSHGGLVYTVNGSKKEIGGTMTDAISNDYPAIKTQGINIMPALRVKFSRR